MKNYYVGKHRTKMILLVDISHNLIKMEYVGKHRSPVLILNTPA